MLVAFVRSVLVVSLLILRYFFFLIFFGDHWLINLLLGGTIATVGLG